MPFVNCIRWLGSAVFLSSIDYLSDIQWAYLKILNAKAQNMCLANTIIYLMYIGSIITKDI